MKIKVLVEDEDYDLSDIVIMQFPNNTAKSYIETSILSAITIMVDRTQRIIKEALQQ